MNNGLNQIYLGDCLELMKRIPSESIDMILCDLPYGTTASKWDVIIPFDDLWQQYKRISKPNAAIVLTASQPFTSKLVCSNINLFRHEWIWQKNCGSNFATLKNNPFKEHESVLVFGKNPVSYFPIFQERTESGKSRVSYDYNGKAGGDSIGGQMKSDKANRGELRHPSSVQKFNRQTGLHPNQKPVDLFEYLIKTYTNENAIVLDNCIGSGTTAIAAINTNRRWVGIEKDPTIFAKAVDRVTAHLAARS